ncbi:hypothetical protein ND861_18030 [Leptospira sp. 2 VSF19]|uniref:Uncharacterized protein n=1 Tax=Leptospira soteropolitanensis TaxID=2950025 RepID=A0AAW5VKU2_9LEPT|nr:hypothetical protein [Leptospira soteropolitanensis]MCW7494581.1 hypothetical protein [Leptospira soteropolitanensis]MCW7502175.1 hypothetical protein [Leptospira soteropolitanensis]MCW7524395.1 hypothetical protein [Leptospira soteropolitanensis]MCW7528261.1 hypothetical protein [Leptospira soteropolitanensis]MCW7532146.1 hypothetical protein [Leptospira soteropolitanensis]
MQRILFLFLVLTLCIHSTFGEEKPSPPGPPKEGYYILTYKNYGLNLEIKVNGYDVRDGSSNEDSSGQADINYWIQPDKNKIKIRLTERKSKQKENTGLSKEAEVKLYIGQKGQFPDEGILLEHFQWPTSTKSSLGEWTEIELNPPFIPPSKLWTQAEPISLTKEKETSAIEFAVEFTKTLNTKDPKKILSIIQFRAQDTSEVRYYPFVEADELKSINDMTKAIGSTWKLDTKKIKFTLLCNNQILSITDPKGEPIITSKKGASIPLYLSWIGGKWVIVR